MFGTGVSRRCHIARDEKGMRIKVLGFGERGVNMQGVWRRSGAVGKDRRRTPCASGRLTLVPAFSSSFGRFVLIPKNEVQAFGVARTDTAGFDTFQTGWPGLIALRRASMDEYMTWLYPCPHLDVSLLAGLTPCGRLAGMRHSLDQERFARRDILLRRPK